MSVRAGPGWTRDGEGLIAGAIALVCGVLVAAWPLASVTYPPMTDLPMHAAQAGALRHFFDPSYHFQDQFELHPVGTPYFSTYALGALCMLVLPTSLAVRVATGIALLMVPAGLAVLAWGMRKSPILGLAAAPLVWCHLAHWGFINFVCAIGIDAMVIGLTLRLVDRPTRSARIALGAAIVLVFFTHVFRFPHAVLGSVGTAVLAGWAKSRAEGAVARLRDVARRAAIVLSPMLPAFCLFAWFWTHRSRTLAPTSEELTLTVDLARFREAIPYLVGGWRDAAEMSSARTALGVVIGVAAFTVAARLGRPEAAPAQDADDRRFRRFAAGAVALQIVGILVGYVSLPMQIGVWWYIYPREITAALVFALALLPDLPRVRGARVVAATALAFGALFFARVTQKHYADFELRTADFRKIITRVPKAPRLLYLVFDHSGSARSVTPWIHLPAWVQADRGGWLVFHFALFDASPFRYRTDGDAIVPPRMPPHWEWEPWQFDVTTQARGFDWFLVRTEEREAPDGLFFADPEIVPAGHEGTWWLYRRAKE